MNYRSQDPMTLNAHDCERMAYAAGDTWAAGILARLADTEDEMLIERDRYANADLDRLERIAEMHHRLIRMLDSVVPSLPADVAEDICALLAEADAMIQ